MVLRGRNLHISAYFSPGWHDWHAGSHYECHQMAFSLSLFLSEKCAVSSLLASLCFGFRESVKGSFHH